MLFPWSELYLNYICASRQRITLDTPDGEGLNRYSVTVYSTRGEQGKIRMQSDFSP